MKGVQKTSDGLFITVWLVLCVLLVLTAGLSAARLPNDLTKFHDSETAAGMPWRISDLRFR